jgi:DNA-binding MurR/RpiR family transcriptional regulator
MSNLVCCNCNCHVFGYGNRISDCNCYCSNQSSIQQSINTVDEIFNQKALKPEPYINQQIFKESIQDNIKAINRIINLYDSQFMQEAKTFLNHAQELILKGLAAND